jgi:hypothetical protein
LKYNHVQRISSGRCCLEKVVLSAIDEDGFSARCVHVLSDEPIREVDEELIDSDVAEIKV